MSKKNTLDDSNLIHQSLDEIMSDRFGRYSKYIIQDRALPDIRDGLKPVQRRILYAMYELNLFHDKGFKKSARVVGEVIGKYHPHGDSSIYEAMVRMAQDWKMNMPLIEIHGNKGSVDNDPAAAMRYTEARLSRVSFQMLDKIKKGTVSFAPNFDDTESEPTVLPGLMPNLLVNGAMGIASGYATDMPPHNLGEIIDAIILKITKPEATLDELMSFVKGPDFPTGGIVQGIDGIYKAFEKGQGRVIIKSKFQIIDEKESCILVTELPYGVVKSRLVRQLDEVRVGGEIEGIKEVRDESDRDGIGIRIILNGKISADRLSKYLLKKTSLQVYYNYNNVGIIDRGPKLMTLNELIDGYIKHQKEIQMKAIKFDLAKDKKRHEIVLGLIIAAKNVQKIIDLIRKIEGSKKAVVDALMHEMNFTKLQAEAIAELRLYRLSRTDQSIYNDEEKVLSERITWAKSIIHSKAKFNKFIIKQLKKLQTDFPSPRKSIIEDEVDNVNVTMERVISHEDAWFGVTREGYVKRVSTSSYGASQIADYGMKEEDQIEFIKRGNTSDRLLVFTSKGRYIYIPGYTMKPFVMKDMGQHINDFANISVDEKIIDAVIVSDFSTKGYIVMASKLGKIKKTLIADFEVSRYSKPMTAMKIGANDEMISIAPSNGVMTLIVIASDGHTTKYHETDIPCTGTKSAGVRAIKLSKNYVTAMTALRNNDVLGLVSRRGGLKRLHTEKIAGSSRTSKGQSIFRSLKTHQHIVADASHVGPKTNVYITSKKGNEVIAFSSTHITGTDEGFSLIGNSQMLDAKIMKFHNINKNSKLFEQKFESDDDAFKDAESKIDDLSKLNILDILKKYN